MRVVAAVAAAVLLLSACAPKEGTVSQGSGSAAVAPPPAAPAKTPTWGERYTWPDGLAIEVAQPQVCKPGEYAMPQNMKRAVKVKVTVVNGMDKQFDVGPLSFGLDAQFAGAKAERVIDVNGPCDGTGLDGGTVLPGKTFSFEESFAVDAKQGELQLSFEPTFGKAKAIYVGAA
ncbi:hypothetical protein [Kibdelosporangium phytohabitans]|uniref:DUF4352 domain-containing protein n=1 Tax=Kibdelosporangium phytohabitans TaxID=860235 RepID=A0A0N7F554_9PSEU|nr:hypothetical protein [Kibdelosporangium phytohabitans]ALG13279.1 hypothetical protein AOZ06_46205 [Kibdelosporangium phytohabitans]MBE1465054.1 hypothetical protein [Kibdelosporangium phytohabitans]